MLRRTPRDQRGMIDANLRRALHRFATPDADPSFRNKLEQRIRVSRSGRRLSLALAAAAVTALASAGVLAAKTGLWRHAGATRILDRTYSCVAQTRAAIPVVTIWSGVSLPPDQGYPRPAVYTMASVVDTSPGDNDPMYLQFSEKPDSFKVDPTGCRASRAKVAFTPKGLIDNGVVTQNYIGGFKASCKVTTTRVDVHLRLTLRDDAPIKALIAVRNQKGGKAVAYLNWTPTRQATFLSAGCAT